MISQRPTYVADCLICKYEHQLHWFTLQHSGVNLAVVEPTSTPKANRLDRRLHAGHAMDGIQFITDEQGRKTAVVIDLKKHREIWKNFYDGLIVESRRKEKDIPFEEASKARAKRKPSGPRG